MDNEKPDGIVSTASAAVTDVANAGIEGVKSIGGSAVDTAASAFKAAKRRIVGRKAKSKTSSRKAKKKTVAKKIKKMKKTSPKKAKKAKKSKAKKRK